MFKREIIVGKRYIARHNGGKIVFRCTAAPTRGHKFTGVNESTGREVRKSAQLILRLAPDVTQPIAIPTARGFVACNPDPFGVKDKPLIDQAMDDINGGGPNNPAQFAS